MSFFWLLFLLCWVGDLQCENRVIPYDSPGSAFHGIGALSGGGGTSRLLWDYPTDMQSKILDVLFKPDMGASLQILKVEIGGDAQSTEATEASHMHTRKDLNFHRGYEWWLLTEAKKRNPHIKTYGLSWGAPGWIGNHTYYSEDNIDYHVKWLQGAKTVYGIDIDFIGIWNEHMWDNTWIKSFRKALDKADIHTQIVAADNAGKNSWAIISQMEQDPELLEAVAFVGAHYPYWHKTFFEGKSPRPLWASECWDLKQVGDWNGAMELARMINRNYLYGNMTAAIMWNLIYAWYPVMPFSNHNSNTVEGQGHSLMYAGEPWSGYYSVQPPIYITAHTTQFTTAYGNWSIVPYDTTRNTLLDKSTFVVYKNDDQEISIVIESTDSSTTTNSVTFTLEGYKPKSGQTSLSVWQTTQNVPFKRLTPVKIEGSYPRHTIQVNFLKPQSITTITSINKSEGHTGVPHSHLSTTPQSEFPFPYYDNMTHYQVGDIVHYFADQGGSWQADHDPKVTGSSAFHQVVPEQVIPWSTSPTPCTYIGNYKWTNYVVTVEGMIATQTPKSLNDHYLAIYTRVANGENFLRPIGPSDPQGYYGLAYLNGTVSLYKGPHQQMLYTHSGTPLTENEWTPMSFSVQGSTLRFSVAGNVHTVSDDSINAGLVALGSGFHSAYFKHFSITK